jgi:hypothetical protein
MDWETLGNIGSFFEGTAAIITLITIIVSFIYISAQTREMREQNELTMKTTIINLYKSTADAMLEIDRFFVLNPRLKPYIYRGKSIPKNKAEYERVMSAAEMIVDYMELVMIIKNSLSENDNLPWDGADIYFKYIFESSPAIQDFWIRNRDWYDWSIQEVIDPMIKEIQPKHSE